MVPFLHNKEPFGPSNPFKKFVIGHTGMAPNDLRLRSACKCSQWPIFEILPILVPQGREEREANLRSQGLGPKLRLRTLVIDGKIR